jgi:protein-tyrosine phosphatase
MGNICRSPTAHGVFRYLVEQNQLTDHIEIDSAGTHAYHVGNPPDSRSAATALERGIDLSDLRARQVTVDDFSAYDYVIAMDRENHGNLMRLCPENYRERIHMFMDFADDWSNAEVPDPYYGGASGFDRVFDMVESASRGLLAHIQR